ncbi:MAG: hypothetical protein KKF56_02470 [Nanoarchaeota archaeon]|nr:hypothetical protein [Nanoarchaeota archaeon]
MIRTESAFGYYIVIPRDTGIAVDVLDVLPDTIDEAVEYRKATEGEAVICQNGIITSGGRTSIPEIVRTEN